MEQNTKEWYEAVEFFERTVSSYGHGSYRFDKETNAPVGHWYQHGETNDAFRMFLYGLEYGKKFAALENEESAHYSLQQMYGAGAEQTCSACCYAALCHFHKKYPKIKGCAHYYG
jgi:hypothetical protein